MRRVGMDKRGSSAGRMGKNCSWEKARARIACAPRLGKKGGSSLEEIGWDIVGKDKDKSCDKAKGRVKSCAGWDKGKWKGKGEGKGKWKPSEEE